MSDITKRALEASLKNLLLKKPLDKITINDIAEDCGISRMTFYYHFKDIYDLVEWSCMEDARRALEGKKTYDTWQQGFLQLFEAVQANRPFIMNVYRSVSREHVETYGPEEDQEFIAHFYKYAFVGLMLDWIRDDLRGDPQAIVSHLGKVVHGSVRAALERLDRGSISTKPQI